MIKRIKQIDKYEFFPEYIKNFEPCFVNHKVEMARKYSGLITRENSIDILDLKEKIEQLYCEIKEWQ